ncbi:MAG: Crp/Fnr family transcriptional regulator [Acidobacteria bacterium]|nr:Crp/Fnr family transcriptional regulator [Acidobacteriota bacterium]
MIATATNLPANFCQNEQAWQTTFPNLLNLPHIEKTFWRGMTIYSLEDMATHLYVVLKGRVKILRTSSEGEQKIVSIRYSGDIFGELALACGSSDARRSEEAVALDTTRVALVRIGDFWNVARRDATLMQNAMQYITRQLAGAYRQIESLVFENNHTRLARALLDLAEDAKRNGEASIRLTHEELAELIGSTREVVTGMMIEFRQHGLIDYKRGNITPNVRELTRFLRDENSWAA